MSNISANETSKAFECEMVSIDELFGITSCEPGGQPVLVQRYKHPNPYTPIVDENFVLIKEQLKSILLGLLPDHSFNVRFVGDKGCGKTAGLAYVLGKLNWGLINIDCHENIEMTDLTGFWVNKKTGMHRIDGPLVQFFKENKFPVAFNFEEMDALPPSTLIGCNQAIQSGYLTLIDGEQGVEIVPNIHSKPIFSTGNTVGGYDERSIYQGTQRQNTASLSRWIVHKVDYLNVKDEVNLIRASTSGKMPDELADVLAEFAQATRTAYRGEDVSSRIKSPFSTREVIYAAKLTVLLQSLEKAIKMSYFDKLDTTRDKTVVNEIFSRLVGHANLFPIDEEKVA